MSLNRRSGGILLPIFSIPGPAFAGTLGRPARSFIDFLADAGIRWWQMLPINPIDFCHSPYASPSTFAGETLYLDPEEFLFEGLLDPDDLESSRSPSDVGDPSFVDYPRAEAVRVPLYRKAFARYRSGIGGKKYRERAEAFLEKNRFWLEDHVLFRVLSDRFQTNDWRVWPEEFRRRAPSALDSLRSEAEEEIAFHSFTQLVFDSQWRDLRDYAGNRGVLLLGDVPIYVGAASVDTWANRSLFQIDIDGALQRVAGAPADAFNPDGQRWDSPLYRWDRMEESGFDWWLKRLGVTLDRFDAVRLDHFIGFYNYYSFPKEKRDRSLPVTEDEPTGGLVPSTPIDRDGGFWTAGPKETFLDAVFARFPKTSFIAEDLGDMTPGVHALRKHYHLPGMEVLVFVYDGKPEGTPDPMDHCDPVSVACSGTHDTQPVAGWLDDLITGRSDAANFSLVARSFLNHLPEGERSVLDLDRLTDRSRVTSDDLPLLTRAGILSVMKSASTTALFPIQDLLGLGGESRINFPGRPDQNWQWRLLPDYLTDSFSASIRSLLDQTNRLNG